DWRSPGYDCRSPGCDCRFPGCDCRLPGYDCRLPGYDCRLPGCDCRLPGCDERQRPKAAWLKKVVAYSGAMKFLLRSLGAVVLLGCAVAVGYHFGTGSRTG